MIRPEFKDDKYCHGSPSATTDTDPNPMRDKDGCQAPYKTRRIPAGSNNRGPDQPGLGRPASKEDYPKS